MKPLTLDAIRSAAASLPKPVEPNWNGTVRRSSWFPWTNSEGKEVHGQILDGVLFCSEALFLKIEVMVNPPTEERVREFLAGILRDFE